MDGVLIVYGTAANAASDLAAFHGLCRQWWPTQGYQVTDEGVVPKVFATGEDAPDAQHTVQWDVIKPDPTDPTKSWWWSPTTDPRFYDWKDYLAQAGYSLSCEEISWPSEWTISNN